MIRVNKLLVAGLATLGMAILPARAGAGAATVDPQTYIQCSAVAEVLEALAKDDATLAAAYRDDSNRLGQTGVVMAAMHGNRLGKTEVAAAESDRLVEDMAAHPDTIMPNKESCERQGLLPRRRVIPAVADTASPAGLPAEFARFLAGPWGEATGDWQPQSGILLPAERKPGGPATSRRSCPPGGLASPQDMLPIERWFEPRGAGQFGVYQGKDPWHELKFAGMSGPGTATFTYYLPQLSATARLTIVRAGPDRIQTSIAVPNMAPLEQRLIRCAKPGAAVVPAAPAAARPAVAPKASVAASPSANASPTPAPARSAADRSDAPIVIALAPGGDWVVGAGPGRVGGVISYKIGANGDLDGGYVAGDGDGKLYPEWAQRQTAGEGMAGTYVTHSEGKTGSLTIAKLGEASGMPFYALTWGSGETALGIVSGQTLNAVWGGTFVGLMAYDVRKDGRSTLALLSWTNGQLTSMRFDWQGRAVMGRQMVERSWQGHQESVPITIRRMAGGALQITLPGTLVAVAAPLGGP